MVTELGGLTSPIIDRLILGVKQLFVSTSLSLFEFRPIIRSLNNPIQLPVLISSHPHSKKDQDNILYRNFK